LNNKAVITRIVIKFSCLNGTARSYLAEMKNLTIYLPDTVDIYDRKVKIYLSARSVKRENFLSGRLLNLPGISKKPSWSF